MGAPRQIAGAALIVVCIVASLATILGVGVGVSESCRGMFGCLGRDLGWTLAAIAAPVAVIAGVGAFMLLRRETGVIA